MFLTVPNMIGVGVQPTQARTFSPLLLTACSTFGLHSKQRQAALLAQCMVESAGLTRLEESLYYRSADRIAEIFRRLKPRGMPALKLLERNPQALANAAYGDVNGNGPEATGDGWRYRGRGLIQLTGRTNYRRASSELGVDYIADPDRAASPADAAMLAAWYMVFAGCHLLADKGDIDGVTRRVNPAMLEAKARRLIYREAVAEW